MNEKTRKAFAIGLALGLIFAAGTAYAANKIISAEYNNVKVLSNGAPITLAQPLISVVDEAAPPNSFANYMPVRTVLESLGYTVTYDGTTETINIVAPVTAPAPTPAPAAASANNGAEPAADVITAGLLVDGEESEFSSGTIGIILVSETDENGNETTALYLKGSEILNPISTAENPYVVEYDPETNTVNVITKPPFEDGKTMREVLAGVDFTVGEVLGQDDTAMDVSIVNGGITAVLHMPKSSGLSKGTLEYEGKTAEFDFYLADGASYIIEESFIQAMGDVGL